MRLTIKRKIVSKVEDESPKGNLFDTPQRDTSISQAHSVESVDPAETFSYEFTSVGKNTNDELPENISESVDETEFVFEIKESKSNSVAPQTPESLLAEEQRKKLILQSQERIKRLKSLNSNPNIPHEQFKDMLDRPAFERKNVSLKDQPHSSDRNISRFNLNDDNEILGEQ